MAITKYSHSFLVGNLNVQNLKPIDLDTRIWKRQIISEKEYEHFKSDYYKSFIDSLIEAEGQTRPAFLHDVCHYSISLDADGKKPLTIYLTKGMKDIVYDYTLCICQLHLYFFPHDVVLVGIEIDDTGIELDLMTLGHASLINMKFSNTGNGELYEKLTPLTDLLGNHDLRQLVKDGNNLKIFQIIEVDAEEPSDELLYEIAAFLPVGAVGGKSTMSPSDSYFAEIMSENCVSAFFNWKALAIVDSFTVLGIDGFNTWTWLNHYYPLIYLRCLFEKTFCFSRNSEYRLDKGTGNIAQQIADMEKYYFYNNISYNFLPALLYESMAKGLRLKEEREEISRQIKERAKEEEEKNERRKAIFDEAKRKKEEKSREIITLGLSVFAIFSVAWDFCSIFKDSFLKEENHWAARIIFVLCVVAIPIIVYVIKRVENVKRKIVISKEVRSHLASHFQQDQLGSKFYATSPEALLKKAQRLFPEQFDEAIPDEDGRIRISLVFPEVIGESNVVNIDELTQEERDKINIVDRQGRLVRSVKTNRVIPTRECQIVLSPNNHLITMFPGKKAPSLPPSPDIHDEFWDNHVFIESEK